VCLIADKIGLLPAWDLEMVTANTSENAGRPFAWKEMM
jgi:hypothetical protein